jgi:hypothetical protein
MRHIAARQNVAKIGIKYAEYIGLAVEKVIENR